jgi:hypothetical protein
MAEPFGANGSGGSLRYGSEMSNASAGDATRQRAGAVYHASYFFRFQPGYLHAARATVDNGAWPTVFYMSVL